MLAGRFYGGREGAQACPGSPKSCVGRELPPPCLHEAGSVPVSQAGRAGGEWDVRESLEGARGLSPVSPAAPQTTLGRVSCGDSPRGHLGDLAQAVLWC